MIVAGICIALFLLLYAIGKKAIIAQSGAPAWIRMLPREHTMAVPDAVNTWMREATSCAFQPLGTFEVQAPQVSEAEQRRIVTYVSLSADHMTCLVIYDAAVLAAAKDDDQRVGSVLTWVDLISELSDGTIVTTTTAHLSLHDPVPNSSTRNFPRLRDLKALLAAHVLHLNDTLAGRVAIDLALVDIPARFEKIWGVQHEYQQARGLYVRDGDIYRPTAKLARRGQAMFWIGYGELPIWRAPLIFAAFSVAAMVAAVQLREKNGLYFGTAAFGLGFLAGWVPTQAAFGLAFVLTFVLAAIAPHHQWWALCAPVAFLIAFGAKNRREAKVAKARLE